jgi:hypothetical protein
VEVADERERQLTREQQRLLQQRNSTMGRMTRPGDGASAKQLQKTLLSLLLTKSGMTALVVCCLIVLHAALQVKKTRARATILSPFFFFPRTALQRTYY